MPNNTPSVEAEDLLDDFDGGPRSIPIANVPPIDDEDLLNAAMADYESRPVAQTPAPAAAPTPPPLDEDFLDLDDPAPAPPPPAVETPPEPEANLFEEEEAVEAPEPVETPEEPPAPTDGLLEASETHQENGLTSTGDSALDAASEETLSPRQIAARKAADTKRQKAEAEKAQLTAPELVPESRLVSEEVTAERPVSMSETIRDMAKTRHVQALPEEQPVDTARTDRMTIGDALHIAAQLGDLSEREVILYLLGRVETFEQLCKGLK